MDNSLEIEVLFKQITKAKTPEDVFGKLLKLNTKQQEQEIKKIFRKMAIIIHPDRCPVAWKKEGTEAFVLLDNLYNQALNKISQGKYGSTEPEVSEEFSLKTSKGIYQAEKILAEGDLATIYYGQAKTSTGQIKIVIKLTRAVADNDLADNEEKILKKLYADHEKLDIEMQKYLPKLLDSVTVVDSTGKRRKAQIFSWLENYYSLAEVKKHYPAGVDGRTAAWMFKRLLAILGYIHKKGIIHGAVLPTHLLVNPQNHGLVLIDWSYAVADKDGRLKAISAEYEDWYPPEVFAKQPVQPATDIYLAAKCIIDVFGGDINNPEIGKEVKWLLKSCLIKTVELRPNDAWALFQEMVKILERLYGPPKFHPFIMPKSTV